MAEETKKISFGFNKLKRQSNLVKVTETNKSHVQYVDSFDCKEGKFSYKGNIRCDEPVKKELVIPLIGTKTVLEVIKLKLENKNLQSGSEDIAEKNDNTETKQREKTDFVKKNDFKSPDLSEADKPLSIDDLAAREILNDLGNNIKTEKSSKTLVIKQTNKTDKPAEEVDIDYENIPVSDFGLAMLRGMGWTPETGIGKDQKVVQIVTPKLRPKGLGLGADKAMKEKTSQEPDLAVSLKSYVRFIGGTYKGNYGQVQAMDDDTGRVTVKLDQGRMVSTSEVFLIPITKKEYIKDSKVINSMKYEDFKEKVGSETETKDRKDAERPSSARTSEEDKSNTHRKERYSRSYNRDHAAKREEGEKNLNERKTDSSSDSSESWVSERSKHRKKSKKIKKSSREKSENRRHKKSKKKKKHGSDYDAEEKSDKRRHKREKSSHHNHHSKLERK